MEQHTLVRAADGPLGTATAAPVERESRRSRRDARSPAADNDTGGKVFTRDLTDRFCRDDRCYHVIGDLIAYRNHGHLTATFARTLRPDVEPAIDAALGRRGP